MYLAQGQIVYHRNRGKCVFVGESGEYTRGDGVSEVVPVVCIDTIENEKYGREPYFNAFTSLLSVESPEPQPQPSTPAPLVIRGQGSYTITITEGDI